MTTVIILLLLLLTIIAIAFVLLKIRKRLKPRAAAVQEEPYYDVINSIAIGMGMDMVSNNAYDTVPSNPVDLGIDVLLLGCGGQCYFRCF